MKLSFVTVLSLSVSLMGWQNPAHADSRHGFDGDREGFDNIRQPISQNCAFQSDPLANQACFSATNAALQMAQRAAREGAQAGWLRGYANGLNDGFSDNQNRPDAIQAGQNSVPLMGSSVYSSAAETGALNASNLGHQSGSSDAVSRFESAVNTGRMPNPTPPSPRIPGYSGESNGWALTSQITYSPQDFIKNAKDNSNSGFEFDRGNLFDGERRGGFHYGDPEGVLDADEALQRFIRSFEGGVYQSLPGKQIGLQNFKAEDLRVPASGNDQGGHGPGSGNDPSGNGPGKGPGGQRPGQSSGGQGQQGPGNGQGHDQGHDQGQAGPPVVTIGTAPSGTPSAPAPRVDPDFYKKIFRETFVAVYRDQARFVFAQAYNSRIDDGFREGFNVGATAGYNFAFQTGAIQQFNANYSATSVTSFLQSYVQAYFQGFTETFADYQNNPKLSVSILAINNTDPQSQIFQPGDRISIQFRIRNSGGAAAQIQSTISGEDVIATTQSKAMTVPALSSADSYSTGPLAQIGRVTPVGQTASINLVVNGVAFPTSIKIDDTAEIAGISSDLSQLTSGRVVVKVTLKNPANINSPKSVAVKVNLGANVSNTVNLSQPLAAGSSQNIFVPLTGVQPLDLIKNGGTATVEVDMMGEAVQQQSSYVQVQSVNQSLADYFNTLVNGQGYPDVGQGAARADALVNTERTIESITLFEVNNRDFNDAWSDRPLQTLPGQMGSFYASTKQSPAAVSEYVNIGQVLATYQGKSWNGISNSRKSYQKLISVFDSNVKPSKKDK